MSGIASSKPTTGLGTTPTSRNGALLRTFGPAGPLRGEVHVPGDKSVSHRALILAAMARRQTRIRNCLDAADTRSTINAIRRLGADIVHEQVTGTGADLTVSGVGLRGPATAEINAGNASTLIRLLSGWLAGQHAGEWVIDGDDSIRRRPVGKLVPPLAKMGADVSCQNGYRPPIRIAGRGRGLRGITYSADPEHPSAQLKSCVLFAGLLADSETVVSEPIQTRDHTERMLARAGVNIRVARDDEMMARVTVQPAERIELDEVNVPADPSSAAFFIVAATLIEGSEVVLPGIGMNDTRTGFVRLLRRMGARIEELDRTEVDGEPIATLVVRHSELRGTVVEPFEVPDMIDEFPLVALVGCFAQGETLVSGAGTLRGKESDRIDAVAEELRRLGAQIEDHEDGFSVQGSGGLEGGVLDSRGDHRLAMMGAVAGFASARGVDVCNMSAARVSYQGFDSDLLSLAS